MRETVNKLVFIIPHTILVVIFFVLHSVNENFGLIPLNIALKYLGLYLLTSLILVFASLYLFKNKTKAFIYATLVLCMFFSFGSGQDTVKSLRLPGWLTSYTLVLSGTILLFLAAAYFLKRSNKDYSQFHKYLQLFFLTITVLEMGIWCYYTISHRELTNEFGDPSKRLSKQYQPCDTCSKPDIYFIVFDAYTGTQCLKREFDFDNSAVDSFLTGNGFYVASNARSNYGLTPLSISSTFNLNYLRTDINNKRVDGKLIVQSLATVYTSELPVILEKEGYDIRNYSIFNLKGYPVYNSEQHARFKDNLIHLQTFAGRIHRDIGWKIATFIPFNSARINSEFQINRNTSLRRYIFDNVQQLEATIKERSGKPKFVYTHLMLPHDPYYFDDRGNYNPDSLIHRFLPELYIKQLIYTNTLLKRIVNDLMHDNGREKIIIIEGDHGYREYHEPTK
ncbi:MAG TPA: sulfatase-like hydrolase/transferase, partial [Chitinophagaceae bacterium]|nr:sulfatase-like hydrolase/transferase [Chitinophagaceae bacterium]